MKDTSDFLGVEPTNLDDIDVSLREVSDSIDIISSGFSRSEIEAEMLKRGIKQ